MSPPRNAMSEPARIGTCRSATALVRVNRGSTWISFAPFSLAFMGQRNATGWHSAMFEPMITKQSVCSRLRGYSVAVHRPLEPDDVPAARTGLAMQNFRLAVRIDVELVNRRALRAERAFVVGAAGIAFDVDDAAVLHLDQRRAPDRAERTDARHRLRVPDAQLLRLGP